MALLFSTSGILMGCGGEEMDCTTEARSSVTVQVVDASGAAVTDAVVKFSVDGGATQDCDNPLGSDNIYTCGYEIAGNFTITATRGGMTGTATATVTAGDCHVNGQTAKITLGS